MNAIEVLEERLKKGERVEYVVANWERMIRFPDEYPAPAATPYEVTPASGVPVVS